MQTKLAMAVLFGFVLVAAAACSRSSDRDRIAQLESDLATSEEARQEAEQEAADARQRADDAEEEAADALQEAADAEQEVADAEQEAADAEQEAADAQQRADDAEEAQRQAQRQQQQLQQQLTEAEQAELRARASALAAQLDAPEEAPATVSWTRGNTLTFRPSGVTHIRGSAAPSVPGGWRSNSFAGQTGTAGTTLTDETVYLYTNIQAPGTRAFWKKYGGDDLDVDQAAVTSGLAKPSTSVSRTRTDPNDPNSAFASATTGGTYDGVSGKFSCTGDENTCTVTRTDDTTTIGGTWTFEATNLNSGAPVDQDDAYLYFGIWSSIPDIISGETYNFRYVAGGGDVTGSDLTGFATLTGSATFSGGAVGMYTTQGQVGGQNAKIGTFTATATLNADFGDGTTAGTLSGRIDNFREDGSTLAGWLVTLGSETNVGAASVITLAAVGTDDVSGSTVANIGGLSVGGSWGAKFYGIANTITGLADREKYPAVDLAGVAGWFDATGTGTNDVSLAGDFAATPQ